MASHCQHEMEVILSCVLSLKLSATSARSLGTSLVIVLLRVASRKHLVVPLPGQQSLLPRPERPVLPWAPSRLNKFESYLAERRVSSEAYTLGGSMPGECYGWCGFIWRWSHPSLSWPLKVCWWMRRWTMGLSPPSSLGHYCTRWPGAWRARVYRHPS